MLREVLRNSEGVATAFAIIEPPRNPFRVAVIGIAWIKHTIRRRFAIEGQMVVGQSR